MATSQPRSRAWSDVTLLLVRDDRAYLREPGAELQTDLGVLTVPEDAAPGDTVETHLGEAFTVREPRLQDFFEQFDRTGAPMMPRDVGLVIALTGIGAEDHVLDAGTGTGILAAGLARLGVNVRTYEANPEFAAVARANFEQGGVEDRIDVRTGDITDVLDDEDALDEIAPVDAITLDTADAAAVVERAPELLVPGGTVVVYSPFVESAREVTEAAKEVGLMNVRTIETIQRRMDFDERGSRPSTAGVGHTGYLTVGQKR